MNKALEALNELMNILRSVGEPSGSNADELAKVIKYEIRSLILWNGVNESNVKCLNSQIELFGEFIKFIKSNIRIELWHIKHSKNYHIWIGCNLIKISKRDYYLVKQVLEYIDN